MLFHSDHPIFQIHPEVKSRFPSIVIGIAIIRGVSIEKINSDLWANIEAFIKGQSHLTNEIIGSYSEVQSYRKLYKEMGIDWHSRRPSPEALLRRISKGKGLYQINTCVDAYNLVVMKNKVSSGAFDLDQIQFPTALRFARPPEEIVLLGDREPTMYMQTELAYFDTVGGYNIDLNYRDAQRTAVTTATKNLYINVDGVYDITREKVECALTETVDMIVRYCGGRVEMKEVVS